MLQELKNGRAAMIAIAGMYAQTVVQGKPILAQLGEAFSLPSNVAKAGYFFPTDQRKFVFRFLFLFLFFSSLKNKLVTGSTHTLVFKTFFCKRPIMYKHPVYFCVKTNSQKTSGIMKIRGPFKTQPDIYTLNP